MIILWVILSNGLEFLNKLLTIVKPKLNSQLYFVIFYFLFYIFDLD